MRRNVHGKSDWVEKVWKGGVLCHPNQQDESSCGVIVTLVSSVKVKLNQKWNVKSWMFNPTPILPCIALYVHYVAVCLMGMA